MSDPTIYYDCGCGCGECGNTIRANEETIATLRARVAEMERDFATRDEQLTVARRQTRDAEIRVASLEAALRLMLEDAEKLGPQLRELATVFPGMTVKEQPSASMDAARAALAPRSERREGEPADTVSCPKHGRKELREDGDTYFCPECDEYNGHRTCPVCGNPMDADPGPCCASLHGTCGICARPRGRCKCMTTRVCAPAAPKEET